MPIRHARRARAAEVPDTGLELLWRPYGDFRRCARCVARERTQRVPEFAARARLRLLDVTGQQIGARRIPCRRRHAVPVALRHAGRPRSAVA